jgi:hypothetical protein
MLDYYAIRIRVRTDLIAFNMEFIESKMMKKVLTHHRKVKKS